jgi:hypothetical protein
VGTSSFERERTFFTAQTETGHKKCREEERKIKEGKQKKRTEENINKENKRK